MTRRTPVILPTRRVYVDLHNINIANLSGNDSLAGQWGTTGAEWITVIHHDVGSR